MSKDVQIGSDDFELPTQGQSPKWGEELSDIVEAIIDSVNTTQGPSDITETSAAIQNIAGIKSVTGFVFASSSVRSFEASYNVSRTITKAIVGITQVALVATCTTSDVHNIEVGDKITISGNTIPGYNIQQTVTEVVDSTSFKFVTGEVVDGTGGTFSVELAEEGVIRGLFNSQGWKITQEKQGESELVFDIDSSLGQITYDPTVLEGTSYVGLIKFLAKAVLKS